MSKGKDKKKSKEAPEGTDQSGICVAAHPRSASAVRRAKGYGGLLGALLAIVLALSAHLPLLDAMLRGLAGGIVGYVALWAVAVAVARQLVVAEVRRRYAELVRATAAAAAEAEAEGA
jgi:hypothetical protein